jgi:coenzyme F420-reducing hydrogenase alpha subunit
MSAEGELTVRIGWDRRRVQRVSVRSTRRALVQRLLAGKRAAEAVEIVPRLFSICRRAQGAAAAGAIGAGTHDRARMAAHRLPVLLEAVQEHVTRLLVDWPLAQGREADAAPVAAVRKRIEAFLSARDGDGPASALRALVAAIEASIAPAIYGAAPAAWLASSGYDDLRAWTDRETTAPAAMLAELLRDMPSLGASDVEPMPPAGPDALAATVVPALARDADFARAPTWDGMPVDTGALARTRAHPLVAAMALRYGNGVATRMLARMVELAALVTDGLAPALRDGDAPPTVQAFATGRGEGVAAVQTARGLLLHRVRLDGDRVAEYQIVAPTEWNFHPDGALPRGMRDVQAVDDAALARQARLVVQALDPCVACRIEIDHA